MNQKHQTVNKLFEYIHSILIRISKYRISLKLFSDKK